MVKRTRRSKIGARVFAAIMSVALGISNMSGMMPGAVAFAETPDESGDGNSLPGQTAEETEKSENAESNAQDFAEDEKSDSAVGEGSDTESSGSFEEDTDNGTGASGDEVSDEELDPSKLSAETEEESDETKESENKESEEAEVKDGSLLKSEDNSSSLRNFDYSKTDVWDFGAEDLGDEYNNRLDVDTINGFYSAEPGTKGPNLASFSVDDGDFVFNDGGYSTTHRLRSTNTSITRYDEKSLKDSDGNVYSGYIYSNKGKTADVYVAVECQADDIITAYVASNGTDSEVHFENMSDSTDSAFFTHSLGGSTVSKFVYYPSETAKYKFYSATEKLVLARVLRKHATYSELSGAVAGYTGTGSFDLVFTNRQNGNEVRATVSDGTYSVNLAEGFDYDLSLDGADEYVITSDKEVNISGSSTMDIDVASVDLALIRGKVEFVSGAGVPEGFAQSLNLVFTPEDENSVYVPHFVMEEDGSFEVSVQAGVNYQLTAEGVDDYELLTKVFKATGDVNNAVISFVRRVVFPIIADIDCEGLTIEDLADAQFKFILLDMEDEVKDTKYSYTFTGRQFIDEEVVLRDGQYRLEVTNVPEGYKFDEDHSYDAIIAESDSAVDYTLKIPFVSTAAPEKTAYRETVTVGQGKEFETISEALEAIRNMERTDDQRVTVEIDPGDYQEMLVIDTPNVTFKNTSAGGSIVPTNQGVSIASDSVRITGYYGHGYAYYSMGKDCKYDAKLLEINKHNGYPLFENPGSGTTAGSYWNATVVVNAEGFEAYDIIFENSFNQYQSELAAADTIVKLSSAKEDKGVTTRAELPVGSTAVQSKNYVERAAAMAIRAAAKETYFNHCAFIGRQDTLYGDEGSTQAYYDCDIYGGTDYIFGGMTAVFAKCDLIFNTSEDNNDVGYITAAQQKSASSRGYLMYNCTVKSTVPGENTASAYGSKAGYLGRPWQPTTSEVVFYDTVIEKTCDQYSASSASLINPEGWLSTLGGTTERNVEYGTFEVSGVDNASARAAWSPVSDRAETTDGKTIAVSTFLGSWDPFTANGDDLTVAFPDGTTVEAPVAGENENSSDNSVFTLEASALDAFAAGAKADGETQAAGTDNFFTVVYSTKSKVDASNKTWEDGYTSGQRINFGGAASADKNAIKFTTDYPGSVKIWWAEGGDDSRQMGLFKANGEQVAVTEGTWTKNSPYMASFDIPEAGSYYVGSVGNNNYIFKVEVTLNMPVVYEFEASTLDAFGAGAKADGETVKAGTDNYFTLIFSSKSKVDSSTKTWEDDYTSGQRVNFGGLASLEKNAIKFTTAQDNATVKVWWAQGGDDNRQVVVLDDKGSVAAVTEGTWTKNSPYISTFTLEKAGTYYLGGYTNNNYFFKVQVTDGAAETVERKAWSDVTAPVVKAVALNENDNGKIDVTVDAVIGNDGGDKLTVYMLDAEGKTVGTAVSSAEKDEFTLAFAPSVTGEYFFRAELSREDEEEIKASAESDKFAFSYPLTAPQFKNATNKGDGKVTVKFYSVSEAESYVLSATDKDNDKSDVSITYTPSEVVYNTSTEYSYNFVGLTVDHTYELRLVAKRGDETSKESVMDVTVTKDGEMEWTFSAFGSGVSKGSNIGFTENDNGSITVWNTGNKGKIVPASTDGLSFYYATIPANKNFTLTATATIDGWTYTNGQEGFGLMAADRVGVNGDSSNFWNNSYMASGTKVEYYYDNEAGEVTTDTTKSKITMKLGLGSQEKRGVTNDNLSLLLANDTAAVKEQFSSEMYPLETSTAANGAGTYNIFAKESSGNIAGTTIADPLTQVRLRIQKNNTGYFVSYLDDNDNVISTKKYYDTKALENLDSENVYVGFFAARTFTATFSDIELVTIDPSEDAPAEEKPISYVVPEYKIISATYSNTEKYELQYTGNADGTLTITDENGKTLVDAQEVVADNVTTVKAKLKRGDNTFTVKFVPSESFCPDGDESKKLTTYDAAEFTHTVKFATINDSKAIYVSTEGKADADGSKENPVDIYTAVKYVQPGQTIYLAAGTYSLKSTVKVERGIDGTPSKLIRLVAEDGRAIFDFNKACAGFIFAGDYWYVKGIDCTHSGNSQKGIQVSGSHITIEDVRTYENGNTGIQVSRYLTTDDRSEWPSYNLILNCTSYSNADAGYEDADGFAAKLTVGDGVVFDGCIAYNNADDGWDLFAKVETGAIGQVTIQNCVAFANGYGVDGTNEGNGNGFKMGGSSISGPHKLINSVAWGNKAKGIDSNSGPDIQVYNSMSFNNGSNNVALYTNDSANTDYLVDGVLSYRTTGKEINENLKAKGTQDTGKIYGKLNFFWKDGQSANNEGLVADDDWFVSLDAPYANASDPYAVAASLRNSEGAIDLGDFMKLTDKAFTELAAADISATDVAATLGGDYEAVKDERDITGSSDDAKNDEEEEENAGDDPTPSDPSDPGDPDDPGNNDEPGNNDDPGSIDEPDQPDVPNPPAPTPAPTPAPIAPVVVRVVKTVVKVVTRVVTKVVTGILKGLASIFKWF